MSPLEALWDHERSDHLVVLKQETGNSDVLYMQLDLASLKSVHCFSQTFLKTESRLDLLINNAGKFTASVHC